MCVYTGETAAVISAYLYTPLHFKQPPFLSDSCLQLCMVIASLQEKGEKERPSSLTGADSEGREQGRSAVQVANTS